MNKKILQEKVSTVQEIKDLLASSSSLLVVSYQGVTVAAVESLRNTLKENGVVYKVYKNTLVTRAFKESNLNFEEELKGANAFVFTQGDDLAKGVRLISKFVKTNNKIVIGSGLINNAYATPEEMKKLASLPDKNGLLSMLLSCLQAPVRKFAATVKAIADTKPQ